MNIPRAFLRVVFLRKIMSLLCLGTYLKSLLNARNNRHITQASVVTAMLSLLTEDFDNSDAAISVGAQPSWL